MMTKFAIFVCASVFLRFACARPDVSLGYHYNQEYSGDEGSQNLQAPVANTAYSAIAAGNSQSFGSKIGNSGFVPSTQLSNESNFGNFDDQNRNYGNTYSGGTDSSTFRTVIGNNAQLNSGSLLQTQEAAQQTFPNPIVRKHFYSYSAPSDDSAHEIVRHIQIGNPQRNYRVIFIDAPSTHSTKAKIVADVAPAEEKTAIYLLSKKNSAFDISAEVNNPTPINNKPEVFFVKYNTPEEVVHLQNAIHAQYDALGGTSDTYNEGQIPVASVIAESKSSTASKAISTSSSTSDSSLNSLETPQTDINTHKAYLPPKV